MFRWQDGTGRLHFSNVAERVPPGAQTVTLRELSIVRPSSPAEPNSVVGGNRSAASESGTPECDVAEPDRLIEAVAAGLESTRPVGSGDHSLTLFVAGTPVFYDPYAVVRVWPAGETDENGAIEQAAIAYPASGDCPLTPPLERYEVAAFPARATGPSALCEDYRRASAEIDLALSRNENVAATFDRASARFEAVRQNAAVIESPGKSRINLPPWLIGVVAAQTGELADEIEEYMEELTVAREEIDNAAQARGCW
jgi:hypothetical protein